MSEFARNAINSQKSRINAWPRSDSVFPPSAFLNILGFPIINPAITVASTPETCKCSANRKGAVGNNGGNGGFNQMIRDMSGNEDRSDAGNSANQYAAAHRNR